MLVLSSYSLWSDLSGDEDPRISLASQHLISGVLARNSNQARQCTVNSIVVFHKLGFLFQCWNLVVVKLGIPLAIF